MLSKYTPLLICSIVIISGCATTESVSPLLKTIESGNASELSKIEYTNLIAGNTIRGKNGSSTVYRADGVKLIREADGTLTERKWYKDSEGMLCHTLWKDDSLSCIVDSEDFYAARSGSTIFTTRKGSINEWELVEGNPDNL